AISSAVVVHVVGFAAAHARAHCRSGTDVVGLVREAGVQIPRVADVSGGILVAFVFAIRETVAVVVTRLAYGAAVFVDLGSRRRIRTLVVRIGNAVAVGVIGTTLLSSARRIRRGADRHERRNEDIILL